MIHYNWSNEKNLSLKNTRGVSFEQVVLHINNGELLAVLEYANQEKYPNQKVLVVNINDYIYYIPFVEDGKERFLKTIIPSRKLTRKYLEDQL